MYIRFDLLAQELQKLANVQTFNVRERVLTDLRMFPSNYDPFMNTLDQDACYICDFQTLRRLDPQLELAPLVCVLEPGVMAQNVFFTGREVITVSGVLLPEIMTVISRICYEMGGNSSPVAEKTHKLLQCRGIRELMDKGAELLGNPLILTDAEQKILAHAGIRNPAAEPFRSSLESGRLPVGDAAHTALQNGRLDADDHPFFLENIGGRLNVMCKRLRARGRVEGYLHVYESGRPIAYEDGPLVDFLGSLIAMELSEQPRQHPGGDRQTKIENFMMDVLNNPRNQEYMEKGLQQSGLRLKANNYCCVCFASRVHSVPPFSFYDLSKRMAELLPDTFGMLYRNSIFLLISSDEEITDFPEFLEPIRPVLEKYGLMAGISNPFPVIHVLREYSFQALKALQLGSVLHEDRILYPYRDYSLYYMIELSLRSENIMAFCMPELIKLAEHSKSDGGDLLETLRVYLRCGRSKSQTAREMYIHLNTVKYRLQQIQKIIGIDFDNDDNALKLMLSFKAMEYSEKFHKYEPSSFSSYVLNTQEEICHI